MQALGDGRPDADRPPAVGRQPLIRELVAHVEAGGPPVLLIGPAGIGKTFVARRVVEALAAGGADTEEFLGGGPASTLPLGPVAHLVPIISGDVPVAGLIAATLERLRRRAARRHLVMLVDDVDLLDNASSTLVDHLSRTPGVTLIATSRTPSRTGHHPNQTWFSGRLQVTPLEPLAFADVAELARYHLGGPLDPQSNHRLFDMTEGNPLWVTELVRSAVSQGAVRPGVEELHLDVRRAVASLESILADRLDSLGPAELRTLDLIAAGGPLPVEVLESMVGPEPLPVLEGNGLIEVTGTESDPVVRYAHPLHRQLVRDGQSLPYRRSLLHQLIEQAGSPGSSERVYSAERRRRLLYLGLWHAETGRPFDPEALGWAAREVQWGLLELTRRHLAGEQPAERGEAAAIDLGMQLPDERADAAFTLAVGAFREDRTFENGMTVARLLLLQPRRTAIAVEVLEDLRTLAADDSERVQVAITHGIWLHWMGRDRDGASELLRQAEKELAPPWSNMAASTRAGLQVHSGQIATSLEDLEAAWPGDDAPPIAQLVNWSPRAAALVSAGRLEEGVALAERALPISYRLGVPAIMAMEELTIIHHWGRMSLGRYAEVADGAHQVAELLSDTEQDEGRALFMGLEARALLFSGRPARAAEILEEAIRRHGSLSLLGFRALLHSTRAIALAWCGRLDEAEQDALQAVQWNEAPRFFDADIVGAQALVMAAKGRRTWGAGLAATAGRRAAEDGSWYFAFQAFALAAAIDPTERRVDALARVATRVDGPLPPIVEAYIRGLLEADAAAVLGAGEAALAIGEPLKALEMLQAAAGIGGLPAAAERRLRGDIERLSREMENAKSPLDKGRHPSSGLSNRELEIE